MFSRATKKISAIFKEDKFYFFFLLICALLPFQFALNPTNGIDLAAIRVVIPIIFSIWIIYNIKNKKGFNLNKISYLILAFLMLATLSLLLSHNISWSLRKLLFLLSIIPIYFVANDTLNTEIKKHGAILALIFGAMLLAIISLIQFFAQFIFGIDPVYNFLSHSIAPFFLGNSFSAAVMSYPSWLVNAGGTTYMRATGVFPDPHMLSYYFGMLIPWSIILWNTSKKYSNWFLCSSILLIAADICTFTRGGYIALIVGLLIIMPLVSKKTIIKIFTAIAILSFMFTIAPHSPVAGRLTSSFDVQEGSNQGRISNWQQAIEIISNNPLGVGIGMYSTTVDPNATYREPIYAHNLYLDIAAELGILTLILFIALLMLIFVTFWQKSKEDKFFIAGVSSITIFAAHSMVESPLYSVHILSLLCIIIAMTAITKKNEKA